MQPREREEDAIIVEGLVAKPSDGKRGDVIVQLYPGLIVEIRRDQIQSLEEATDSFTGRTHVRLVLKEGTDVRAVFQPRLAKLAAGSSGGVPFSFGGLAEAAGPTPLVYTGGAGPKAPSGGYDTIGEHKTRCYRFIWGWVNDDTSPYWDHVN